MRKLILLVSIVITALTSCSDNPTNENADNSTNNTAQYTGYWNYTTKGTLIITASDVTMSRSINKAGIAKILQDSVYSLSSKTPNELVIRPDIFSLNNDNNLITLSYSGTPKIGSSDELKYCTHLSLIGTTISGTRADPVLIGTSTMIYNSNYTGTKSGNTITIKTNFSNYNNSGWYNYSGSATTILTKVN